MHSTDHCLTHYWQYELELAALRSQLREREQGVVDKRELLALEEERKRAVADRLQAMHELRTPVTPDPNPNAEPNPNPNPNPNPDPDPNPNPNPTPPPNRLQAIHELEARSQEVLHEKAARRDLEQ